jgi:23S rRNA pseudouridine2605 synthase
MAERIQKVLARAGLGSRRQIEGWIAAGRIRIDGRLARLGERVEAGQQLSLDGKMLAPASPVAATPRVIAYHKPVGLICTRDDPEGRTTVFSQLPQHPRRWIAVGRLDINTSGLMLFTDDGELANQLMHPRGGWQREYAVRLRGAVDDAVLRRLRGGVELDDGPARFEAIHATGQSGSHAWFQVSLAEGRNREVRRLWESQGLQVSRLIRTRFGPVNLPRAQPPGSWWELDESMVNKLAAKEDAGYPCRRQHRAVSSRAQGRANRKKGDGGNF